MSTSTEASGERADAPVLIGVDVGTSSVRAIAFDLLGHRIAAGSRQTPIVRVETGGEYDPEAIFEAVKAVLAEVGVTLAARPVAAIAVASIGESCVLIGDDGRPLAPSIAWFDRRTVAQASAIAARIDDKTVFEITGHGIEPIFTLFKLAWMRKYWPDAIAKARRVLMIADWIAFRLSGEAATDPTLASRTLYLDIGKREWSGDMLELAGIDADLPAPIAASGTALGPVLPEVLAEIGLAGSPLVAVGGHDHTVGAFAAGLAEPGTMVNSIGTAEALLLSTPQPLRDPETIRRGYVQGAIATDSGTAYLGGSLFSSGGAIDWLRSIVGDVGPAALIAEASAVPVGSRGVVFLPYLANGPPPHPDENARGAFFGLTPSVKRAELYRAVLEGLAIQSRMMLDGMVSLPGVDTPRRIRLIGGVSRNDLFLRIKANAFGRPIHVVEEPEATALGTALLGGVGAGLYADLDAAVAGLDQREDVVEPDASVERYDRLRTMVFEGVQDMVRPINRGLAEFNKSVGTAGAGSDPAAGEHASMQRDRQ